MFGRIERLSRFESPSINDWVIYFAAFTLIQIPAIFNFYDNQGAHNPYILFAQSLLEGRLDLAHAVIPSDLIVFKNNFYLPYPPLPSVLLVPFVAILGMDHVNTVAVATIMACISLYLMYSIFFRLHIAKDYLNWILVAVFFGTGYWFAIITTHHVYAFAQITSFMFQLLVINELLGKRRWWLAGVYIGCAFLCRQLTIFYIIFAAGFMFYLHREGKERITLRDLVWLCSSAGLFVLFYLGYNYARFGNPLDTGYEYIHYVGILRRRVEEYGVFSGRYVLFNLYSFLIKGFNVEFEGSRYLSIKDMDLWGTSLLSASPFLIASIKASWPKILKISTWATIIVILFAQLFYHNNGYHQINTSRFSLDFLPLLLLLTALGATAIPKWLFRGMIAYAILLNLISFVIHFFYQ